MKTGKSIAPRWITVRLGDDLNWWLDQTSETSQPCGGHRGILDPRQISQLIEVLHEYRRYGFHPQQFADAFQIFAVETETAQDRLRLAPTDEDIFSATGGTFALPVTGDDNEGAYDDFLDAMSAARIRRLNATHHYARNCTQLDMEEELSALGTDRYFSSETIHVFDEINEILQWSPTE
jgi:hypothetical protein